MMQLQKKIGTYRYIRLNILTKLDLENDADRNIYIYIYIYKNRYLESCRQKQISIYIYTNKKYLESCKQKQISIYIYRQIHIYIYIDREANRETDSQTDREKKREKDRETDRYIDGMHATTCSDYDYHHVNCHYCDSL